MSRMGRIGVGVVLGLVGIGAVGSDPAGGSAPAEGSDPAVGSAPAGGSQGVEVGSAGVEVGSAGVEVGSAGVEVGSAGVAGGSAGVAGGSAGVAGGSAGVGVGLGGVVGSGGVAAGAAAAAAPPLVDRPLPYGPDREALTVAYLRAHRTAPLTGDAAVDTRMTPRVVVLHWTAGPTAESAWSTFAPARLAGRPDLADAGALNVGAHYLVDRDGTITRLAPEDRVLRHCIGLNHLAIGIENVGGGATWPLTEAQVAANAALVRWIAARQPITHLIGHLEYRAFEGHPYFEERDPTYRTTKPDPGAPFMAAVRARVADLELAGAPKR